MKLPFEERVKFIENYIDSIQERTGAKYIQRVQHEICQNREHLKLKLAEIESLGGEGLMLRSPKSSYEERRSSTLLKVKSFSDREAKVVGYEPGLGRFKV